MPKRRHLKTIAENGKGPGMFFVRRPKIAALVGITLAIWGILSAISIPKESAPYIAFGVVNIATVYPGASAIDVDQLVTQEIEDKIKGISGVSKYSSLSRDGVSNITLEFNPGQDMTKAMGDVRSKVDEARASLPNEIDNDPNVVEIDSSLEAFVTIVLSGDVPIVELTDTANNLKNVLENIGDVAEVNISGGAEREIAVIVDQQKIDALGISLSQVQSAIRSTHADVPIGNFEISDYEYSIRFEGKLRDTKAVEEVVIINMNAGKKTPSLITVGDIAEVVERGEDTETISRFAIFSNEDNHFKDAVRIAVSKRSSTDILGVDKKTTEIAETFRKEQLPAGVTMEFTQKGADIMREDYKIVIVSGLESVAVVMLFIFFFVGVMEGLVASIVIPITFLITIGVLAFLGKTLNFMTNFSMILSLGILVDTAIVIVEGAHHFIKQGYTRKNAALLALHEYRGPLLAGTLTTLAVFIPLLSLSGVLGQYLSFIPVTVIIVLIASLFVSLILLPAYASKLLPRSPEEKEEAEKNMPEKTGWWHRKKKKHEECASRAKRFRICIDRFIDGLVGKYKKVLSSLLRTEKRRLLSLGFVVVAFITSMSIPVAFVLFPQGDQPYLSVTAEMPEGATTEHTDIVTQEIEEILRENPEILFVQTSVSGKSGTLQIELLPKKERDKQGMRNSLELERDFIAALAPLEQKTGALIRAKTAEGGPPSEFPVGFRIVARDQNSIESAKKTAIELTEILKNIPKTAGVKNNIEEIPGEFQFRINHEKVSTLGVNPDIVAATVRTALQGSTAASFSRNGRDVDIVVELDESKIESIEDILNIQITTQSGVNVPMKDLVFLNRGDALAAIRRSDGDIAFTVSSLLDEGGNAEVITQEFLKRIENVRIPKGVEIINAGENEDNADLMADLSRGFVVALLLMFLILVVQFNAFIQPLLVLFTILFAQIGVAIGLWLTGTPRSLAYILGAIALAGIVVNDAIIMIDQMNKNRRQKQKDGEVTEDILVQSVIDAGTSRFIPVVLTTLTTSAGIAPLIFQDAFWAGLSYTVIFGLMVASFLTLFLTPATYIQFQRAVWKTLGVFVLAVIIGVILNIFLGKFAFFPILIGTGLLLFFSFFRGDNEKNEITS